MNYSNETKKPVIILTGPTAVGKTDLSIALAHSVGGEIISADSAQVYRGMDIGSAKITKKEMQDVPHHLIDVLDPTESFHVVLFQELAKKAMEEIWAAGHIPIITGGTGFYIQALLNDIDFSGEPEDTTYRTMLEEQAARGEGAILYEQLQKIDPRSCETIHANNIKRVIRALEFYHLNGYPISEHNEREKQRTSPYNFIYFVLNDDRAKLYERIDRRVDIMLQKGLVAEVAALKEKGLDQSYVSMQALGYKEILDYLDGSISLDEAVYRIKRDSRHFAKRQLTWFRREKDVTWMDRQNFENEEAMLAFMMQKLREKEILVTIT